MSKLVTVKDFEENTSFYTEKTSLIKMDQGPLELKGVYLDNPLLV
jgi:hypothetical protein